MSRSFNLQYPTPYSNCAVSEEGEPTVELPDAELFEAVHLATKGYSQKTCFSFCIQTLTYERCGCQSNRIAYNITGAPYCPMHAELTCAAAVANYGQSDELQALFDHKCRPNCPLECFTSQFHVAVSNQPVSEIDNISTTWRRVNLHKRLQGHPRGVARHRLGLLHRLGL